MGTFLNLQVAIVQEETGISTWDIIMDSNAGIGWIINLGLIGMLIFAAYIFYERFFALRRASREEDDFVDKIKALLLEGNIEAAKKYCSNSESPSAPLLEKGISRLGKPIESIASSVENASKLEGMRLRKGLPFLSMTAGVAPLLGVLGGAISAFRMFVELEKKPIVDAAVLSSGMMVALVTVIIGVTIGACAYAGYKYLVGNIEKVTYLMETDALEFMDMLHQPGN